MKITHKEVTYSNLSINISSIAMAITIAIAMPILFKCLSYSQCKSIFDEIFIKLNVLSSLNIALYLTSYVAGIFLHVITHGSVYAFYSLSGYKAVKFGFKLKGFILYSQCTTMLTRNQYSHVLLLPYIIQGIIPLTISIVNRDVLLFLWSLFFMLFSTKDILILIRLFSVPKRSIIRNHPTKNGFIINQ